MLPLRIGSKGRAIDLAMRVRHRRREDLFERLGVRCLDIGEHNGIEIRDDARHVACDTDLDCPHARKVRIEVERRCHLEQDRSIERLKEIILRNIGRKLKAEVVAETHLRECRRNAAAADALRGEHLLPVDQLMHLRKVLAQTLKDRKILHITRNRNHDNTVAGVFELRREHLICRHCRHRKGDERRRNIQLLERAGHRVLAADGRNPELMLGTQRAEERRKGLAPLIWVRAEPLKVLLQRQPHPIRSAADGDNLRHGLDDGIRRAMEWAPR